MRPNGSRHHIRIAAVLVSALVAAAILVTVRSYSHSDHVTYSDIEISTDEGLFSMMIPMARLAPGHAAVNDWKTYTLFKANGWTTERWVAGGGTKFRVREYIAMLGKNGNNESMSSAMLFGFGYVLFDATWASNSRPGSMLWLIAPVWAVAAVSIIAIGLPVYFRARFGIRSLMLFTLLVAVILVLPTLHAPL